MELKIQRAKQGTGRVRTESARACPVLAPDDNTTAPNTNLKIQNNRPVLGDSQ